MINSNAQNYNFFLSSGYNNHLGRLSPVVRLFRDKDMWRPDVEPLKLTSWKKKMLHNHPSVLMPGRKHRSGHSARSLGEDHRLQSQTVET